jgi:hypothetical protein
MYNNTATFYGTINIISTTPISKNGFGRIVNITTEDRGIKKDITLPVWDNSVIENIQNHIGEYIKIKCGVKIDEYRGNNYVKHYIENIEVL